MKRNHLTFAACLMLTVGVSGCCGNCSGLTKTTEARESFIDSYNQSTTPDCTLVDEGGDLTEITLTCTNQTVSIIESGVEAGCMGYQMVGFETLYIEGTDGTAVCDIEDDCSCN